MVAYIKLNSFVNKDRDRNDHLPFGFEGFFYAERKSLNDGWFGFINLSMPDECFYLPIPHSIMEGKLKGIQQMCIPDNLNWWGPINYPDGIVFNIPKLWDITDLIMRVIKQTQHGLFINWPLDPPRIGGD